MGDPILAELERERFGDLRDLKRERLTVALSLRTDGPRNWLRRRQVLLDCLENIPQDYRRGSTSARRRLPGVLEWAAGQAHADAGELREAA